MDQEGERAGLPWTDEEVRKLEELAEQGLSGSEIGQRLRRSKYSVAGKIRSSGIEWPRARGTPLFGGVERAQLAQQLRAEYEDGATIRDLADRFGRSYGQVYNLLVEAGATLRRRGKLPKAGRQA